MARQAPFRGHSYTLPVLPIVAARTVPTRVAAAVAAGPGRALSERRGTEDDGSNSAHAWLPITRPACCVSAAKTRSCPSNLGVAREFGPSPKMRADKALMVQFPAALSAAREPMTGQSIGP